jgi:hypothetical protein
VKNAENVPVSAEKCPAFTCAADKTTLQPGAKRQKTLRDRYHLTAAESGSQSAQARRAFTRTNVEGDNTMKTGSTAVEAGLYVSECCLYETTFVEDQTFTRCPKCSALTVWEMAEKPLIQAA